jgi:MoxR-like ATPase
MTDAEQIFDSIRNEVKTVLIGNDEILEMMTISLVTRGHILLEGVPGVAKTTIAKGFAQATGLDSKRIQMTPDLLPADITGTHIYRESVSEFELQRGPIFTNVLVVDEINRATPKTQSALLEAMQEGTVTIEGETLSLPDPFVVIATQNPIEMEGTYELPEAQRDRFQLKSNIELPNKENEIKLLHRFDRDSTLDPTDIEQVVTIDSILSARESASETYVSDSIKEYIRKIIKATRDHSNLSHGGSPRATLSLQRVTKAKAAIEGREYVIPDDVKQMSMPVLVHRLLVNSDAQLSNISSTDIIDEIVTDISPPSSPDWSPDSTISEERKDTGDGVTDFDG